MTRKSNYCLYILVLCALLAVGTGCRHSPESQQRRAARSERSTVGTNSTAPATRDKGRRTTRRTTKKKLEGTEIFAMYNTAVFMVYTTDNRHSYQGSGFFIDNDGLAVSNYHVFQGTLQGAEHIKLANDDDNYYHVKEVIKSSKDDDFILFRVDCTNTNYIPIAEKQPVVGEKMYAIGSPRGLENTLTSGEVSQRRGDYVLQISVPIDHGSSGGALINEQGEVVGITSAGYDDSPGNLNFAYSIDLIKPYL